jgi:hypothetical protein
MKKANPAKIRFKVACLYGGTNMRQFAKKHGVSQTLVSFILNGKRKNRRISDSIDKFVAKHGA